MTLKHKLKGSIKGDMFWKEIRDRIWSSMNTTLRSWTYLLSSISVMNITQEIGTYWIDKTKWKCKLQNVIYNMITNMSMCAVCMLSRVWLCSTMDCCLPCSSVNEIPQARILEWVAISFSRWSSWLRDQTCVSRISCIGRWILYQWATSEVPNMSILLIDAS